MYGELLYSKVVRFDAQEEQDFFKDLEKSEKNLYIKILSYKPLTGELLKSLYSLLDQNKELTPTVEKSFNAVQTALKNEADISPPLSIFLDHIRLFYSPRRWVVLVAKQLNKDNSDKSKRFNLWANQVLSLRNKVTQKKNYFAQANAGLVAQIVAKKFRNGTVTLPFEDLHQEAFFGLMTAIDKFDHERGLKFSTYSTWWIRHALQRAVSDKDRIVRIPVHVQEKMRMLKKLHNDFIQEHGYAPTETYLAKHCKTNTISVQEFLLGYYVYSLDVKLDSADGDGATHADLLQDTTSIDPSDKIQNDEMRVYLKEALSALDEREKNIIMRRFGFTADEGFETQTLNKIGTDFGLSRERVRQLENEALKKMKNSLQKHIQIPN